MPENAAAQKDSLSKSKRSKAKERFTMSFERAQELFQFIQQSPSCFHAIATIRKELLDNGFIELSEGKKWALEAGKSYFVTRNQSSVIAFKIPTADFTSFHIVASHSDSPTYKLKENNEVEAAGKYVLLNTEPYGGMIASTWFDRPLSIAGRVLVKEGSAVKTKLVSVDRDLVMIPNMAIHMNREINSGYKYNPQVDMMPIYGDNTAKGSLKAVIAEAAGVKEEDILGSDLFLYNRQQPCIWGANREYISCPKLDDLECSFVSLKGFLKGQNPKSVSVYCVFDNEEVGSGTKQGAKSTFMPDVLKRINAALGRSEEDYHCAVASSFMVSADNAHAVHPNHPEMCDKTNRVFMNEGIVIKANANQKYCTDAVSSAVFKSICQKAGAPYQIFHNRSDVAGGSTLGNLSNAQVSLNAVDIGLPQLGMHSSYETAGVKDIQSTIDILEAFYNSCLEELCDGDYSLN